MRSIYYFIGLLCLSTLNGMSCFFMKATTPKSPCHTINSRTERTGSPTATISQLTTGARFAAPSADDKGTSSLTKVQEMAAFLASQLLAKVMQEAAKDEKDSKLDLESVMKLAETLGNMAETKKAQDKLDTTWTAAGDAVEEKMAQPLSTEAKPETSEESEDVVVAELDDKKDSVKAEAVSEHSNEVDVKDDDDILELMGTDDSADENEIQETSSDTKAVEEVSSSIETTVEDEQGSAAAEEKEEEQPELAVLKEETEASESSFDTARIPSVISMEFGKPLDVEESGVPALREPLPKIERVPSPSTTTATTLVADTQPEPSPIILGPVAEEKTEVSASVPVAEVEQAQDSENEKETLASAEDETPIDEEKEIEANVELGDEEEEVEEEEEENVEAEEAETEAAEVEVAEEEKEEKVEVTEEEEEAEAEDDKAEEDEIKAEEEKQEEEEKDDDDNDDSENGDGGDDGLAAKYATMPLEDRAYSILKDLGMLDNMVDGDDTVADEGNSPSEFRSISLIKESLSFPTKLFFGWFRHVQQFLKQPRERPRDITPLASTSSSQRTSFHFDSFPTKESPLPSLLEGWRNKRDVIVSTASYIRRSVFDIPLARSQPLSDQSRRNLAAYYGRIDSVEDRAFSVLYDLGMVEKNNNNYHYGGIFKGAYSFVSRLVQDGKTFFWTNNTRWGRNESVQDGNGLAFV